MDGWTDRQLDGQMISSSTLHCGKGLRITSYCCSPADCSLSSRDCMAKVGQINVWLQPWPATWGAGGGDHSSLLIFMPNMLCVAHLLRSQIVRLQAAGNKPTTCAVRKGTIHHCSLPSACWNIYIVFSAMPMSREQSWVSISNWVNILLNMRSVKMVGKQRVQRFSHFDNIVVGLYNAIVQGCVRMCVYHNP